MSTHRVQIVRVGPIAKHPNADALGITQVWGYTAIVRLGDVVEGDLAIYVEPDYVVPAGVVPFAFLEPKHARIKAKRLRGVWSQGLLVKALEGHVEGQDVMAELGITRYEPPVAYGADGDAEGAHPSLAGLPKYDVESLRRYPHLLVAGEPIIATEKVHGANARFAWRDGRMWCGSRTQWKRESEGSIWWKALRQAPWIEAFCRDFPGAVLFGEVYGQVQDLKYGAKPGEVRFVAFDAFGGYFEGVDGVSPWWPYPDLHRDVERRGGAVAPLVYNGPFDLEKLVELSRGDSLLGPNMAEGLVVKPLVERTDPEIGRVAFKVVSDRYLERS